MAYNKKTTHYETRNVSKNFFTETLRIMSIKTKCIQLQTNQPKNFDEINVQSLNVRPIIAQTGTRTYNAA